MVGEDGVRVVPESLPGPDVHGGRVELRYGVQQPVLGCVATSWAALRSTTGITTVMSRPMIRSTSGKPTSTPGAAGTTARG
ncbi:hypothetical protein CFP66_35240 [Pseudonocardia sp. MH-G8]|nr:hypothetical protein CFP66_35240 [Pseudonocardia sp. MH-G8]